LNKDGRIHVVPAKIKDKYIIRFTVTSYYTTEQDIRRDWSVIKENADNVLAKIKETQETKRRRRLHFQSSLVLANAPQTPKLVNASFLAFVHDFDLTLNELAKELKDRDFMQSHLPLTPRRKPKYLTDTSHKNISFEQLSSQQILLSRQFSSKGKVSKIDKLLKIKLLNLASADPETKEECEKESITTTEDNSINEEKTNRITSLRSLSKMINNQSFDMGRLTKKFMFPQASLDSKIEYIFENADDPK